ncbi:protein PSK SIMULATOR 1-like [Silene latifolia]|uniref:protein PSK SIMULATOR 1-like n=1 Tax=Silene latifolia TaxID=37657 RepID=UPI003D77D67F
MGLLCSKSFNGEKINIEFSPPLTSEGSLTSRQTDSGLESKPGSIENHSYDASDRQVEEHFSNCVGSNDRKHSDLDDFYDGIPRVPKVLSHKSRSVRSSQAAVAKVSEVSVRLGRAGTMGFEKAVEVLDVLGSSMTDLNSRSGFASGVLSKGTKISILAFEVANTIMKGVCLMNSLSESRISHLKEVVLPSEAVQKLVTNDLDVLLRIVACDKREELSLFSGEVIRFGNRCKDPQWHNLDRYFLKQSREGSPHKQLKEDAESVTQQLTILVQHTAELYHELHALHRFEQDYQSKCSVDSGSNAVLREELKKQKKLVMKLKKRSLWSRSLEEIMEKLVDVVLFLYMEIHQNFGSDGQLEDANGPDEHTLSNNQRLGPAGLALHYANIILQIDGIVARSSSMPANARESLYQSLPPSIKSSLRSKLQSFHVKEELTMAEIKAEMEKTLQWLVPIASNTVKSHHGFGWVGEWANSGFDAGDTSAEKADSIRIETLYHADKLKTEAYITDQLVWLHCLISQSRIAAIGFCVKSLPKVHQRNQSVEVKSSSEPSTSEGHDTGAMNQTSGMPNGQDSDLVTDTSTICGESSMNRTSEMINGRDFNFVTDTSKICDGSSMSVAHPQPQDCTMNQTSGMINSQDFSFVTDTSKICDGSSMSEAPHPQPQDCANPISIAPRLPSEEQELNVDRAIYSC